MRYSPPNKSDQMYQIAPGTIVWLCDECIKEMEIEVEKEADKESVSASGLAVAAFPAVENNL